MNLVNILENSVEEHPEKGCIGYQDKVLSYREIYKKVARLGENLKEMGVNPGEPVVVMLPNIPEFLICSFAAWKIGAILVPISPKLKSKQIKYIINDLKSSTLITFKAGKDEAEKAVGDSGFFKNLLILGENFTPLTGSGELNREKVDIPENEICTILYTSGSTGVPKGVEYSPAPLMKNISKYCEVYRVNSDDKALLGLPYFSVAGLVNMCVFTNKGGTILCLPKFDPEEALNLINREDITFFLGVATMYNMLLRSNEKLSIPVNSLRACICTGESSPVELLDEFEERFNTSAYNVYGSTEAQIVSAETIGGKRKEGSAGPLYPEVETKIIDNSGKEVQTREIGEIITRSPYIMNGYYKKPEETKNTIKDSWYYSGDLGYMDSDNFLYIAGRKDDMIIRGGNNIYPGEVEDVIYTHPAVSEVIVYGIPDDKKGQEVKADIVLKPSVSLDSEEIIKYCKEKIAPYKAPGVVEFVNELKRGLTGKTRR